MKKQHIAAAACLVAGAIGFAAVYSTKIVNKEQVPTEISQVSSIVEPTEKETPKKIQKLPEKETESQTEEIIQNTEPASEKQEEVHFAQDSIKNWPLKGDVLIPFSMEKTIYFPTLDQYQYNRGMVIRAQQDQEVCAVARGKIIDIYDSEETGCTIVQDLGDGVTAIYGQLKDLNYSQGDIIDAGVIIGYVDEPTKYYLVEGPNIYFALEQDGTAMDPMIYFGKI